MAGADAWAANAQAVGSLLGGSGSGGTSAGDVEPLRKVLDEMSASMTPEGMDALFTAIFKQGFEKNMPTLLNTANTTGIRPQDSTTQQLMTNDLISRLTGQAAGALQTQQANAGNVAAAIAEGTKSSSQTSKSPLETVLGIFGL